MNLHFIKQRQINFEVKIILCQCLLNVIC